MQRRNITKADLEEVSRTVAKEKDIHKLLIGVSEYMLEHDPVNKMQEVVTYILKDLFVNERIEKFEIETIEKRNQLETYFYLTTLEEHPKTHKLVPCRQPILSAYGGGIADVAFFLIRIMLLINHPSKPRKILFADEPCKNLSKEYQNDFMKLIKGMAKEFGIQIIMTTHEERYRESADQVFLVQKGKHGSRCKSV